MIDDPRAFARAVPKVDLHCHLTGSVGPETVIELARKHELGIDVDSIRDAFAVVERPPDERDDAFFRSLDLVAAVLQDRSDLERAAYEIVERGVAAGNLRYLELFFNPTALGRTGLTYPEILEGILAGTHAAEHDFGTRTRLIAGILRDEPLAAALQMVDDLIAHPSDEVLGIAMDGPEHEPEFLPHHFVEAYRRAGDAGLRRTAHVTETPPGTFETCLDELGCERIDHGYPIVQDLRLLDRARDEGVSFTCCLTITKEMFGDHDQRWRSPTEHPVAVMIEHGVAVSLGTDDGAVVATDIGQEYDLATEWFGWQADDIVAMSRHGLDAAWLDDDERRTLRGEFDREIDALLTP